MSDIVDSYFHFYDKLLIEEKMYVIDRMKTLTKDKDLSYFDLINSIPTTDFINIITEMKNMNEEYDQKQKEKDLNFIELNCYEII